MLATFNAPEQPWTLPRLASLCHLSRATLVRQFEQATGSSPIDLLTEIRMAHAVQRLGQAEQSVAAIGEAVGYQSEAAFQRALSGTKASRRPTAAPGRKRPQRHPGTIANAAIAIARAGRRAGSHRFRR